MPTTALYHWTVSGCPVDVLIELPVVERLRVAALAEENEIGGLLIGSFDGNYTIISDFEEIESEHRRGVGYQLSTRDERKMAARIEAWAHRKQGQVVGAFRSHRRPGLYLDESDYGLLSSYFRNSQQVALLVKPEASGTANGGFFFWEDGDVNRKQTYLQFPMDAQRLEDEDFPLVEPVSTSASGHDLPMPPAPVPATSPVDDWSPARVRSENPLAAPVGFELADTIDAIPTPRASQPVSEDSTPGARRAVLPAPQPASAGPRPSLQRYRWSVLGMIAALAAFGGYVFGTASSHNDRFGSRPDDISVNSQPPAPDPPKAAPVKQAPVPVVAVPTPSDLAPVAAAPVLQTAQPLSSALSPPRNAPKPIPAAVVPPPRKTVSSVLTYKPGAPPAPAPAPIVAASPTDAPAAVASTEAPSRPPGFAWSHYAAPAPTAKPAPLPEPGADSAVSVEPVESGALKRVARHIPLFGSIGGGGSDFTPPQVIHSFAPKVPADLARSLTGPLPIDLKLKLDKTGRVRSVEVISKQKSPEFTELAGGAAYRWQFEPAHVKNKTVPSEVIAHFRFRPAL